MNGFKQLLRDILEEVHLVHKVASCALVSHGHMMRCSHFVGELMNGSNIMWMLGREGLVT